MLNVFVIYCESQFVTEFRMTESKFSKKKLKNSTSLNEKDKYLIVRENSAVRKRFDLKKIIILILEYKFIQIFKFCYDTGIL